MDRQNAEDRGETIYSPIAMVFVFVDGERELCGLMYIQIIKDYVKKVMWLPGLEDRLDLVCGNGRWRRHRTGKVIGCIVGLE